MSRHLVQIALAQDEVTEDEAREAFAILAPVIGTAKADPEALDIARRIIERIVQPASVLSATLDWWFLMVSGEPTARGETFRLPSEIPEPVRSAMEVVRGFKGAGTPAQTVRAARTLANVLPQIDAMLELDAHGAVKLSGERPFWTRVVERLEPAVEALRAGNPGAGYDMTGDWIERELSEAGIDEHSRRWREMRKRVNELTAQIDAAIEAQAAAQPWLNAVPLPNLATVDRDLVEALGAAALFLLDPILANVVPALSPQEIASRIETAAVATDRAGQCLLASVVDTWVEENQVALPILGPVIARRTALEGRISNLEAAGVDVTDAHLSFLEHDLDACERALDALNATHAAGIEEDRRRRRIADLRKQVEQLGNGDDPVPAAWLERLEALAPTGGDEFDDVVRDLKEHLASIRVVTLREDVERLYDELVAIEPPQSTLIDLEVEKAKAMAEEHAKGVLALEGLAERISATIASNRNRRRDRNADIIASIQTLLSGSREEIPDDEIGGFEDELKVAIDLNEAGDVIGAATILRNLEDAVAAVRQRMWKPSEGEGALIDHIIEFCGARVSADPEDIRRLHVAFKTKPFVILSGLTGSGKSSVARLYAEAIGASTRNGQFRRIAVRPDWIDQTEVLGFVNPMSGAFEPGWMADVIRDCEAAPDRMFFVLLDEMNLAPVEQYLAEWLSALEEARSGSEEVAIPLYPRGSKPNNHETWPSELALPPNLTIVGTVNVDETTRPLSDRVIDRANVIQLKVGVTDEHHGRRSVRMRPMVVTYSDWRAICVDEPDPEYHDALLDIAEILNEHCQIGVGVRAHIELERFVANSRGILAPNRAFDWGVVQRVIPKIRGYKGRLVGGLEALHAELETHRATVSARIVRHWLEADLSDDDFLDGADHAVGLAQG